MQELKQSVGWHQEMYCYRRKYPTYHTPWKSEWLPGVCFTWLIANFGLLTISPTQSASASVTPSEEQSCPTARIRLGSPCRRTTTTGRTGRGKELSLPPMWILMWMWIWRWGILQPQGGERVPTRGSVTASQGRAPRGLRKDVRPRRSARGVQEKWVVCRYPVQWKLSVRNTRYWGSRTRVRL